MIKDKNLLTLGRNVWFVRHYMVRHGVIMWVNDLFNRCQVLDTELFNQPEGNLKFRPDDLYLHEKEAKIALAKLYQERAHEAIEEANRILCEIQPEEVQP